ncbi:hypothetical protein [Halobaculum limi]|nr:hypothetical protein [Halobaculum sp. YSMS11]
MSGPALVGSSRISLQSRPLAVGVGLSVVIVAVSELLSSAFADDLHAMVL